MDILYWNINFDCCVCGLQLYRYLMMTMIQKMWYYIRVCIRCGVCICIKKLKNEKKNPVEKITNISCYTKKILFVRMYILWILRVYIFLDLNSIKHITYIYLILQIKKKSFILDTYAPLLKHNTPSQNLFQMEKQRRVPFSYQYSIILSNIIKLCWHIWS